MCYSVPKPEGVARGMRDTITIDTECTCSNSFRSHFSLAKQDIALGKSILYLNLSLSNSFYFLPLSSFTPTEPAEEVLSTHAAAPVLYG